MKRSLQVALGTGVILLLLVGPVVVACRQQSQPRNFRVVRPGVLYRSGQLTRAALERVIFDYGIKTVISLRDGQTPSDLEEEAFCAAEEINFVRILPSRWGDEGGSLPIDGGVQVFCKVLRDPRSYPVLVHCFGGVHRAGIFTAIYRMEFEHWSNPEAIAEMKAYGYTALDREHDIRGYIESYCPSWKSLPKDAAPPASVISRLPPCRHGDSCP
jgi:protein tyrosine/serine phosphatase